jgi:hypothetical protein
MRIDINEEMVADIVRQELLDTYRYLKKGKHKPPLYSFDPEEEKALIAKEMDALKLVLKNYGVTL